MTEVVSIRFKSCGKNYYFSPGQIKIEPGTKVIVDTAKGLEIAECTKENHMVEDEAVVQPLRNVVRVATAQDLRAAEMNRAKEKEAFEICKKKIAEHGLDMKLVGVECNFEGSKTLFFFTSDGRVDFRELVKDLASVFHNRIELRQIGVRDEAKLIGGIGICGRPYCCSQFLEDFAPVSTKMAKTQSLSLNPAKISGSCGRLMCCLRYEEEAYEDLIKKVPKQGAFVETVDGYGTAVQVNILRQTVKVVLDGESEDSLHQYRAEQVAAVPGGRPAEGEAYPHVLDYSPEDTEEAAAPDERDVWSSPSLFAEELPKDSVPVSESAEEEISEDKPNSRNNDKKRYRQRRGGRNRQKQTSGKPNSDGDHQEAGTKPEKKTENKPNKKTEKKPESKPEKKYENKSEKRADPAKKQKQNAAPTAQNIIKENTASGGSGDPEKKKAYNGKRRYYNRKKKNYQQNKQKAE
ncbi:MAG: stage 0 sporulation family protein [Eubacteriales bacterium]|nr:stage 0 sporulation family protein [Eubacteriales bacterium]